MAMSHLLKSLQLAVVLLLVVQVCADNHYVTFWPLQPNNGIDSTLVGEPRNNDDFFTNWLSKDVAGKSIVFRNGVNYDLEGKGKGTTFFFGVAGFDENLLIKYQRLQFLRAIIDHNRLDKTDPTLKIVRPGAGNETNLHTPYANGTSDWNTTSFFSTGMQKRDSLTWVTGADRPLRSISSPKSQNNDIVADTCYYFSDTAGLGARVYVLDDGVNGAAENYWSTGHGRQLEWMFGNVFWGNSQQPKVDTAGIMATHARGHGTCMASFAVGTTHGVAKLADITAVKDSPSSDMYKAGFPLSADRPYLIDIFSQIVNDIMNRGIQEKAVILMSWLISNFDPYKNDLNRAFYTALITLFKMLNEKGAAIVVAQANQYKCTGPPCWFADPGKGNDYLPWVISVGPVDIHTGQMDRSFLDKGPQTNIYGPASDSGRYPKDFTCPDYAGTGNNPETYGGTSSAAAFVAGLIAYYKGLGFSDQAARGKLWRDAYARTSGEPSYIWNGARTGKVPETGRSYTP